MKRFDRIRPFLAPLVASAALLTAGCSGNTQTYGGVSYGYGYGYYDPWYRDDIIVAPPDRPARPTHPIQRPPVARPTPLPARPMPRSAPARRSR